MEKKHEYAILMGVVISFSKFTPPPSIRWWVVGDFCKVHLKIKMNSVADWGEVVTHTPLRPNSFIFMEFSQKIGKITGWHTRKNDKK